MQIVPSFLHSCQQSQSSLLIWNWRGFFGGGVSSITIEAIKAAFRCHCESFLKGWWDFQLHTSFGQGQASTAAAVCSELPMSSCWQRERTRARNSRGCHWCFHYLSWQFSLLGPTLWLENALMMTRIFPDEVPLRKTLNPHRLQAAGVPFCNCEPVSWVPFESWASEREIFLSSCQVFSCK